MSLLQKLGQARAELAERDGDPWKKTLEGAVRDVETIGSAALLDLLRVPSTTDNARRLAKIMRSLGFIPIKSRRLMPGGFRDTTTRGWTRPVRLPNQIRQGEKVGILHLNIPARSGADFTTKGPQHE